MSARAKFLQGTGFVVGMYLFVFRGMDLVLLMWKRPQLVFIPAVLIVVLLVWQILEERS